MCIAIMVDRITLDIFKDDIRLSRGTYARIQQFCDIRMREAGNDCSFAPEAFLAAMAHESSAQKFHGRFALKSSVAAFGEPNASHASLADERNQPVGSYDLTGQPLGYRWQSRAIL